MNQLDRLLEAWVDLSPKARAAVTAVAEAMLEKHAMYPTAQVERPTIVEPTMQKSRARACVLCAREVPDPKHQYCPDCGCLIPD